uniref:Glycosyltransferase n=1 Tax=Streptococcus suis TaxID=1307 RepID=A0A1C9IGG7_STRSU|nr:Glycosyltransferase [Streptococcus suis]AOP03446.1 Glycosyltransferase [Streptococcus suis]
MERSMKKYLKFILNSNFRFKVLARNGFFKNMPDDIFLKKLYKIEMGKELNLLNPSTYNEKLQWLKLHDRQLNYIDLVDKYKVKEVVADTIGEQYVVPTLGVWERFEDIEFDKLPNRFVLKCTHDSGSVVICRNKEEFDKNKARRSLSKALKHNFYYTSREWCYKDVPPRIIAEEYLEDLSSLAATVDYKFFFFNGRAEFMYISRGFDNHDTAQVSFYDLEGEELEFCRDDFRCLGDFTLPPNFSELRMVAEKLYDICNAPFVRIDLYSINGRIYFSEFTFYPASGFLSFSPNEVDGKLGELLDLSQVDKTSLY